MTMNKYFKEKEYIEGLLKKNKLDSGIRSDLKILAKYYRYQGQDKENVEESLYEFCEKKCNGWFNKVRHYKMIDNAVIYAFKEDSVLIQIKSIEITKKEMEFIDSLKYEELEKKIIFSLLVINKLNNTRSKMRGFDSKNKYFGGSGEYSYKSLMDTLNEKLTRTYREKGIHKTIKQFNDDGLTRTTNRLSLELLFLDMVEDDDNVVLEVEDFDNIGLVYDYQIGKIKKVKCRNEKCENLYFKKGNNNQYCLECSNKNKLEKYKKYNKKRQPLFEQHYQAYSPNVFKS